MHHAPTTVHRTPRSHARRRGVTLPEVAVSLLATTLLGATTLAFVGQVDLIEPRLRSEKNLQVLHRASASFANDNGDRQVTAMPEDYGTARGDCNAWIAANGCFKGLSFGTAPDGRRAGIAPPCPSRGGAIDCATIESIRPISFQTREGSFRYVNAEPIHAYVNGRYFDPVFWAPDDPTRDYRVASRRFGKDVPYAGDADEDPIAPTYAYSAAALWHPDVLGEAFDGFRDPDTFDESHRAPRNLECTHPSLKVRMIEHPAIARLWSERDTVELADGTVRRHLFAEVRNTRNRALFFDGSVRLLPTSELIASDERVRNQEIGSIGRLWSRTTPLGGFGYAPARYDIFGVSDAAGAIMLTIDGIRGRDVIDLD